MVVVKLGFNELSAPKIFQTANDTIHKIWGMWWNKDWGTYPRISVLQAQFFPLFWLPFASLRPLSQAQCLMIYYKRLPTASICWQQEGRGHVQPSHLSCKIWRQDRLWRQDFSLMQISQIASRVLIYRTSLEIPPPIWHRVKWGGGVKVPASFFHIEENIPSPTPSPTFWMWMLSVVLTKPTKNNRSKILFIYTPTNTHT